MKVQYKILIGCVAAFVGYAVLFGKLQFRDLVPIFMVFGILAALIYGMWKMLFPGPGKPMFCQACGHEGPTKQITKGSTAIELILWLLFLVPGLIYSIWRHNSRTAGCEVCGATTLIPPNSPMALQQKKTLQG